MSPTTPVPPSGAPDEPARHPEADPDVPAQAAAEDVAAEDVAAEDVAVQWLRAADPSADAVPVTSELRSAVETRRAVDGAGATRDGASQDELAAARRRRRTSWPARVAVAAAAALVVGGGGGYAIGAAGEDPRPAASAISLEQQGGPAGGPAGAGGTPETAAGSEMSMEAAAEPGRMATDMSMPAFGGRTVFSAAGLSDAGGSAPAWALDPGQVHGEQTVAAAAAALGVEGAARLTDGYWLVGAEDGSGPNLTLSPDGTAALSYYDPTKEPWACTPVGADTLPEGPTLEESQADPAVGVPGECGERDLGPAPGDDAAVTRLRELLAGLGLDADAFEYVPESWGDDAWRYVTAHHVLEGQRTGLSWSAAFTGAGLQSLYGGLAPVVELGQYEVVSPNEAVERLSDPRFGGGVGWRGGPLAYAEGAMPSDGDAATSGPAGVTLPPTVTPGAPFAWPVEQVTIVEARLGVALHTQPDGAAVLLPSYELTSSQGGIWSVVAVTEGHLDFGAAR